MKGLKVNLNSSAIGTNGNAIAGLYAAGELAEGILGNNRLDGNARLDCVYLAESLANMPVAVEDQGKLIQRLVRASTMRTSLRKASTVTTASTVIRCWLWCSIGRAAVRRGGDHARR